MLRLSQASVVDILSLACYMQFTKAIQLCRDYIQDTCKEKGMSFEKAQVLASLGEEHYLDDLSIMANKYIAENFLDYIKSNAFLQIENVDTIVEYLHRTDIVMTLNKLTETQVCKIKSLRLKKKVCFWYVARKPKWEMHLFVCFLYYFCFVFVFCLFLFLFYFYFFILLLFFCLIFLFLFFFLFFVQKCQGKFSSEHPHNYTDGW